MAVVSPIAQGGDRLLISTFYVSGTTYGLDTDVVREVIKVGNWTKVHGAAEYIKGISNLRGRIVTIIDLGQRLNLSCSEITSESRIFIVEWRNEYVGLLVDAVSDVVVVDVGKLMPPPSNVGQIQGKYFKGICQSNEGLIAIMNIDEVLRLDEDRS